jgi:hypothetical protein
MPFQEITFQTVILSRYLTVCFTQSGNSSSPDLRLTNVCLPFIICTVASSEKHTCKEVYLSKNIMWRIFFIQHKTFTFIFMFLCIFCGNVLHFPSYL